MGQRFAQVANRVASLAGHYITFLAALLIIAVWGVSGPFFHFSDTWQLVINTGTTIVTFLMVFLIQNTQNRDAKAMHLKLDELIRAIDKADNTMMLAEEDTDEELEGLKQKYEALSAENAELRAKVGVESSNGQTATGSLSAMAQGAQP
jgi:low affinity Fe/Cu permease